MFLVAHVSKNTQSSPNLEFCKTCLAFFLKMSIITVCRYLIHISQELNLLNKSKVILFGHPQINLSHALTQEVSFISGNATLDCSFQVGVSKIKLYKHLLLLKRNRFVESIARE
jgi:hypothetical protein